MSNDNFDIQPNALRVLELSDSEDILRQPSSDVPVSDIGTSEFQIFLKTLYQSMFTVELEDGWMHAGISAVQIGKHLNVFYAYDGNMDDYRIFINPQLKLMGDATDVKVESCLSIPGQTGKVSRHKRVRVTYYDKTGNKLTKEFTGWNARVIQHEYDHLQGVLFTDKVIE